LNKALGYNYDAIEEYASARNAYRAALHTSEGGTATDPDAHTLIGTAYFHDGRDTLLQRGYISAGAALLDSAIGKFQQALKYNENWAPAHRGLGLVYDLQAANYASNKAMNIVSHSFQEAEAEFKKALQISPDYAEAMADLGACYNRQQRWDEAVQQFEAGLRIAALPDLYAHMATALIGLQRYPEAITAGESALALDKTAFEAHNAIGLAYYYMNTLGEAIRHFQLAINLQPDSYQAYTNLGNAYFMAQSWHRARASYRRALDRIPEAAIAGTLYQRAYLNYLTGRAFANAGMQQDAVLAYNEALTLDPSYFDCLRELARSYVALGKFRAGERALRTALQKSPGPAADSEVHQQLGQLFETEGRAHEAIIQYSTAVQIDPNNASARGALERLQGAQT
jgi:tetratricopeptide (TPR) repeat protein